MRNACQIKANLICWDIPRKTAYRLTRDQEHCRSPCAWKGSRNQAVEGASIRPDTLPSTSIEAARITVAAGNEMVALGDLFDISGDLDDRHLILEGDLRQVRGIASRMLRGHVEIRGDAGSWLGEGLAGGSIVVEGSVEDWAGAEMAGGLIRVKRSAGNFLGGSLPGSRLGMREGVILVDGDVGEDAGLAMRPGVDRRGRASGGRVGERADCRLGLLLRVDRQISRSGDEAGDNRSFWPRSDGASPDLRALGLLPTAFPDDLPAPASELRLQRACGGFLHLGGAIQWRPGRRRTGGDPPSLSKGGPMRNLNARASRLVEGLRNDPDAWRVTILAIEGGGTFFDCGIKARGGLALGLQLARICLSGLADVALVPGELAGRACPMVQVATDHPVLACLGSQYAGWPLVEGKFFAMGSGPMRACHGHEAIIQELELVEETETVVGVLEGRKNPPPEIVDRVAGGCRVPTDQVILLGAPTASLAGGVQVVARSVETAMHKLHVLGYDLTRVVAGYGIAPLPPVAKEDLSAIGRTNDAILYGGRVVLYVRGSDESIREVGPKIPSNASGDHGEPFEAIFARYNHDFYAVDPHLFSPAEVTFQNVETGLTQTFGKVAPKIVDRSFHG